MAGGSVIVVHSVEEYNQQHDANPDRVIIVDFTATWCGPCRTIGPYFEELSTQFDTIVFLKVDVDELDAVATACNIAAMPTFQVYKNGKKIDEVVGAAKDKLKELVEKYAPEVAAA